MARFGRFESVHELHRTGVAVVYSGQEAVGNEEKFALKVFQPSPLILGEDLLKSETDLFLNSACIQQKVAASGAQHWAPIYECDSIPDGTFYVTDKYDRSLQQLMDGKLRISNPVLHAIVKSIGKGLIELKEECGRPHGNIKATNVLMTGTGEISQTRIVLSDPSSDEQYNSEGHWEDDLRAIARFIYELVTHRPTPAVDGWQVPDSPEWAKLGKKADGWRSLCNLLLSASVRSETITIEKVIEELEKLREVKKLLSPRRLIAAGIVLIALIAMLLVLILRPPPPPEKAEWESLCNQYQAWIDDLRQHSAEQVIQDRWSRDPRLGEILEKIETASYPDKIMRSEAKLYIREIIEHPEYAEQRKTQDALAAIEQISSFFDPNSSEAWPFLAKMADAANKFKSLDWQKSAAYLGELVEKAKPEPNKPIVENVNLILEISRKGVLNNIDLSLQNMVEYEKTIKASGDPILVKLDYVYVTNQVADASDVDELNDRLGKLVDQSQTIAEFIESNWQTNIDQETFSNDHGNDSAETPTELTFTERLDVIKEYFYLRPDPREAVFSLVDTIESYIKEALISNPKEANACTEDLDGLRPGIKEIQVIKPIAKNEQQINKTINQYKPRLDKLLDRADRARELPRDYVQRIQKEYISTAKDDKVNGKWIMHRDKLLNEYPLSVIEQNLESYAELRQKIEETRSNLIVLNRELQTQLPLDMASEAGEKSWKRKLANVYELERNNRISNIVENIPLKNGMPDVNDGTFKDFGISQSSEFKQWRADLAGIFTAFDAIEDGLELCYLLDEDLPQSDQNIRSVWQKWKDADVLKDTKIRDGLSELIARINRLEQIEQYDDQQELVRNALDTSLQTEAAYAAWIKLGKLPDSAWPIQYEDLTQDRKIRNRMKEEFDTVRGKNEARGDHLFEYLADTSLKHETEFIESNSSDDKILGRLVEFVAEVNRNDPSSELQKVVSLLKETADFVAGEDWQTGNIEKVIFSTESNVHNSESPVTTETFNQWLTEVKDYKKLDNDPRNNSQYLWDEKISKINKELNNELQRKPEGDYLAKLQSLKNEFDSSVQRVSNMRELPLIEKYKGEISRSKDYWIELLDVEKRLKPAYCKRLDLDNGRLIFATKHLHPNFEPVDTNNKNPVQLSTAWEQIRGAVNNKQEEWLSFFHTIDGNDVLNVGWPKYIRSTRDPTVILIFIPANQVNREPFYMAIHEITNRQYRLFLEKHRATRGSPKLPGWSIFTDQTNNKLIQCTIANTPPTAIKWDQSGNTFLVAEAEADLPVTWVTYYGAQTYSRWLGGQLPSASQHEYACRAGTGHIQPWGENITEIGSYAHVRGLAWQNAASEWSREKDRKVPPLPVAPVGAIEDYLEDKTLDPNEIVHSNDAFNAVWPVAGSGKSNAWGLYDMIGNVWEWCLDDGNEEQSVICGGSCVAPPKYILLESESDYTVSFSDRDNDVGFRVTVPAR
jgi:formylglycine-generating enzyme required for sulfatase activity